MYNKNIIISDTTLTTTNLKNSYKQKISLPFHKAYHVANIKIEAI